MPPVVAVVETLETASEYVAVPPVVNVDIAVFTIARSGAPTVTGSLAVSLALFVSPPVATDAELVTDGKAEAPTVTDNVMVEEAPTANGPACVQVTVAPALLQLHPLPVAEL